MNKKDMIKRLSENKGSIISFPDRGPWGSSKYRGNTSGWVIAQLLYTYGAKCLTEVFAGSGTGSDVARDWEIPYRGLDLNPSPVRKDILTCDILNEDVPDGFFDGSDMTFMHPPYSELIKIGYADKEWKDTSPEHNLYKSDLGQMGWDEFVKALNCIVMKCYAAQEAGTRTAILMGDIRRNGRYYSMLNDIVKPGATEAVLIKKQNNYSSMGRTYARMNWLSIEHEYILIFKKLLPYFIDFMLPTKHELDIRDSKSATWRDVLGAVMGAIGEGTLDDIYNEIEGCEKAKMNKNWKAKVRQTLQLSDSFVSKGRGIWAVAA